MHAVSKLDKTYKRYIKTWHTKKIALLPKQKSAKRVFRLFVANIQWGNAFLINSISYTDE